MAKLKKIVNDKVAEIRNIISNETETEKVISCSDELLAVTQRQLALEERTEEMYNMISNVEEELVQMMMEDYIGECPYCGEEIPLDMLPEDGKDFECPKCHNIIELEMMFDDCDCDCDECNGNCNDEDDEEDED